MGAVNYLVWAPRYLMAQSDTEQAHVPMCPIAPRQLLHWAFLLRMGVVGDGVDQISWLNVDKTEAHTWNQDTPTAETEMVFVNELEENIKYLPFRSVGDKEDQQQNV